MRFIRTATPPGGGGVTPVSFAAGLTMGPEMSRVRTSYSSVETLLAENPVLTIVKTAPRAIDSSLALAPSISKLVIKQVVSDLILSPVMAFGKLFPRVFGTALPLTADQTLVTKKGVNLEAAMTLAATVGRVSAYLRAFAASEPLTLSMSKLLDKIVEANLVLSSEMAFGKKFLRVLDALLPLSSAETHEQRTGRTLGADLSLSPIMTRIRTTFRVFGVSTSLSVAQTKLVSKRVDSLLTVSAAMSHAKLTNLPMASVLPLTADVGLFRKLVATALLPLVSTMGFTTTAAQVTRRYLLAATGLKPSILGALEDKPKITEVD